MKEIIRKYFELKYIVILVILITIIKISISLFLFDDFNSVEDYRIASNLVNNNGYTLYTTAGPTALKAPIYPLVLSAILKIFGSENKHAIIVFQCLLSGLNCLFVYLILLHFFSKRTSIIVTLVFLFYPSYLYYSFVIESTNLFLTSILGFVYLTVHLYEKQKIQIITNSQLIIYGISIGVIILIQPVSAPLFFIPLYYLFRKRFYANMLKVAILVLITLSPWTIRNYLVFHEFIAVKSPFWMNIYTGYLPENHLNDRFNKIPKSIQEKLDTMRITVNDVKMEKEYRIVTKQIVSENIRLYLEKALYQAYILWTYPPRYFHDNSLKFLLVRKLPHAILNILFVLGLVYMFKKNKISLAIILYTSIYFTILYAFTHAANTRFKLDFEWIEFFPLAFLIEKHFNSKL